MVLADVRRGDWVLCQITSHLYGDARAILLTDASCTAGEECMGVPDIHGGWLSKQGRMVYTIIPLNDTFVWRVIHPNGVTETGN